MQSRPQIDVTCRAFLVPVKLLGPIQASHNGNALFYPIEKTFSKKIKKSLKKGLTFPPSADIIINVAAATAVTKLGNGPVVQLVRTLACHARGRQFEPDSGRHLLL